MKEQVKKTIEMLKERVRHNLDIIHANEKIVRVILDEPFSESRSKRLEEKYNENKILLKENNDSIQLQLQLSKYLEAYGEQFEEELEATYGEEEEVDEPSLTKEDYFDLTIRGKLKFTTDHPYYDDEEFFNALLEYYTSIEDYETCSMLVSKRNFKAS